MEITGNFVTFLVESVGICSNNLITSLKFGLKIFNSFSEIETDIKPPFPTNQYFLKICYQIKCYHTKHVQIKCKEYLQFVPTQNQAFLGECNLGYSPEKIMLLKI